MKALFILTVVCIIECCSAGLTGIENDPELVACAKKLNVDLDLINKLAVNDFSQLPDGAYCFFACVRDIYFDRTGMTKVTIYEEFMDMIKKADRRYGFKNKEYAREDLENILNKCHSKELNDCDYLKCIKMFEDPLADFLMNLMND